MRLIGNRKGVALMLVLSAITVLTMVGVEFAYNTSVYYNLVQNEADRLKAYYLARSAYNFMRLELKFNQTFQQVVKSQNLGQYLGANAQLPLCQQFPLSTGLIRAVFIEGAIPGMDGEEEGEASEAIEEMRRDASISQGKQAEEFLSFDGDFDGECEDEGTKIDLNGFFGLSKESSSDGLPSPFDRYKQFLYRFMSEPRFGLLFESAGVRVLDVVNSIGDWVDADAQADDFEGRSAGAEISRYESAQVPYQIRNGKLVTLMEAYLIDGVVDDWFGPMMDYFTIYGGAGVNVCTASEEVVQGVIRAYLDANPEIPPMRLEDPAEMERLLSAIAEACASGKSGDDLKNEMNTAMAAAVGELSGGQTGATVQVPFASFVSTESKVFSLKLGGQVGEITVRIKAVVDTSGGEPSKWRLLYWRVY
ncbi:MAG: general secretion pathway protein GspK [Proteobacteria bacterium]|nr:general secretion pathway protein GspK [Pseudomonadota bacterium]